MDQGVATIVSAIVHAEVIGLWTRNAPNGDYKSVIRILYVVRHKTFSGSFHKQQNTSGLKHNSVNFQKQQNTSRIKHNRISATSVTVS